MNDAIITTAELKDIDELVEITKSTWLETYPNHDIGLSKEIIAEYTTSKETRDNWKSKIENKGFPVWIAVVDERIVGYITPNIDQQNRNRLGSLYVLCEYQGTGVGSVLVKKAKEYWKYKPGDIYLFIADYNLKSIEFYKKHGFDFTNAPIEYYQFTESVKVPILEMVCKSDVT